MATKLTLRNTKGSPLTFQEGDDNFIYVDEKATAGIAIGKVYDTKEAGLAAVRDTDTFWVQGSGDIGAILYRRVNSTTATELKRVLSDQFKADLADPTKGAEMIGGFESYARKSVTISSAINVSVPYDFPDLQSAVDAFSAIKPANNSIVNIWIEEGFSPRTGIDVKDRDCRHIYIRSENDLLVTLDPGFSGAKYLSNYQNIFIRAWRATPPALGCLIDANDAADVGYCLHDGAHSGRVLPGAGVKKSSNVGLLVAYGSSADAAGSIFTEATLQGVHCTTHSIVSASEADFSGVRGDSQSSCASVVRNSSAYLRSSKMNNALEGYGVRVSAGASVDLQSCETIGNYRGALRATGVSSVNYEQAKTQKGSEGAILCVNGSMINAVDCIDENGAAIDISFAPNQTEFNIVNRHGVVYSNQPGQLLYGGIPNGSVNDLNSLVGFKAVAALSTANGIFPSAMSGDVVLQIEGTGGIKHQLGISRNGSGRLWLRSWDTVAGTFKEWSEK